MGILSSNKMYDSLSATYTHDFKDTIVEKYIVEFNAPVEDPDLVILSATLVGPDQVPVRNSVYDSALVVLNERRYVKSHQVQPMDGTRKVWIVTVNYGIHDSSEHNPSVSPLNRPPVFNIEFTQADYVVRSAKNALAFPHGSGKEDGSERKINEEGPITNTAGVTPDSPIIDTEQNAVLVVKRNYPNLGAIASINAEYSRTTNSTDTVQGFKKHTLKYLLTESEGQRVENDELFFPGVTRIEVMETTDLILDNVGYRYWDPDAKVKGDPDAEPPIADSTGAYRRTTYLKGPDKGEITLEPAPLKLDGSMNGDPWYTIKYYHLKEKNYASLLTVGS